MTGSPTLDTRDMVVVHDALRRELALMPPLVRDVGTGDLARTRVVADHVAFVMSLLHHHHQGEDRLLWPVLQPRVPGPLGETVALMERQHQGIHESSEHAGEALARWRAGPDAIDRDALADALEEVADRVNAHLAAEEADLLPLAGQHLSEDEWGRLGQEGMAGVPRSRLPLVFGMLMYRADPQVIAGMLAHVPLLPRLVLPRVAPRIHARYARRVHGTATP